MLVQRGRAHGCAEFQHTLYGDDFHLEVVGGVENEGIRRGKPTDFQGGGAADKGRSLTEESGREK